MPLTHFPHGVSSFGCMVPTNGTPLNGKTHYWVHGNLGNDGNSGLEPSKALATMAKAFTKIASGDVIHVNGNIKEQVSTPAGIFDVTIIGETNRPRHADAHTGTSGYSVANTWKSPAAPAAATPLLKIRQQGWRVVNILFVPPADAPAIMLFRDGGAGDAERDASHANIVNCRFDAGQTGIQDSGGCAFVVIEGCLFRGQTGKAVGAVAGAGIGTLLCWDIANNRFHDNAYSVVLALSQGTIRYNTFGKFTTMSIDLANGVGNNMVFGNTLFGTYSVVGGYRVAAATDEWGGNFNVLAGGVTAADPA